MGSSLLCVSKISNSQNLDSFKFSHQCCFKIKQAVFESNPAHRILQSRLVMEQLKASESTVLEQTRCSIWQ